MPNPHFQLIELATYNEKGRLLNYMWTQNDQPKMIKGKIPEQWHFILQADIETKFSSGGKYI